MRLGRLVNRRRAVEAAILALLAVLPALLPVSVSLGGYQVDVGLHHATLCALFVVMAMGLNLSIGFAGLLDLGFIAFVAVGAYAMAIALTAHPPHAWPWAAALLLSIGAAAAVRAGLGATCLRLRGDYLAIVTLGFGEIARVALKNDLLGATGGPDGIFLSPALVPEIYAARGPLLLYYAAAAAAAASCVALRRWRDSRVGRAWEAIREDEVAAAACGVDVFRARLWAYGLGGVFAGIAGGLFALHNTTAHPTDYEFVESMKVVVMVVLGGMGSVGGVAAGAVLFILFLEFFRAAASLRVLIFGATLVALMVWRPQGFAGSKR